jgi:hypothetical protein
MIGGARRGQDHTREKGSNGRSTIYRGSKFMFVVVVMILCFMIFVGFATFHSVVGISLTLAGVGACLWYLHVAQYGVSVSVEGGTIVIRNPARIHVIPLAAARGFTLHGTSSLYLTTADGKNIEIAAAIPLQRGSADDVRKRAQELIAMVDRQDSRSTGPVVTRVRRWSVAWLSVTTASMLIGFVWLFALLI